MIVSFCQGSELVSSIFNEESGDILFETFDGRNPLKNIYTSWDFVLKEDKRLNLQIIPKLCGLLIPWKESEDTEGIVTVVAQATRKREEDKDVVRCVFQKV